MSKIEIMKKLLKEECWFEYKVFDNLPKLLDLVERQNEALKYYAMQDGPLGFNAKQALTTYEQFNKGE